jgi:hypothetical protein
MDGGETMHVVASYPLDAEHVVARLSAPVEALDQDSFSLASGLASSKPHPTRRARTASSSA